MAVALGLSLVLVILVLSGWTDRPDNALYDAVLRARSSPTPGDILIVAIDERSLSDLGAYPWRRSVHAALLRRIAAGGPKAVIDDVLFLSPTAPNDDRALGAALREAPNAVIPVLIQPPDASGRASQAAYPIPTVRSASRLGQSEIIPDSDGVVRRLPLALDGQTRWLSLAAMAARADPGVAARLKRLAPFTPTSPGQSPRRVSVVPIRFGGPPGHIRTVSVSGVLRGEVPDSLVHGQYVLVGATAVGLGDRFATPLGPDRTMSGVEIQANFLDTLLHGRPLRSVGPELRIGSGLAAVWLSLLGFAALRAPRARALWLGLLAGLIALSAGLFWLADLWLAPTASLIVTALVQPIWAWLRLRRANTYVVEELSKLAADADLAARPDELSRRGDLSSDPTQLVRQTVARVRGLRRLVNAAVRSLPDATVLLSLGGEIVLANQEARRLFHAHGEVTRDDVEAFFAATRPPRFTPESFASPEGGWAGERAGADGALRDIRYVPWTDESGRTLGWVVRFADITALRRAEIAREEALQLLTHDMRAPQASIIALVPRWEEEPPDRLREWIAHYARRTIALADDFLRLARADAGGYDMAPIDLADVMTEAVDDLWALSTAKTIAIRQSRSEGEYMVLGNRSLLMRALANLLDNAVKFSEPGSRIDCEIQKEERASGPVVIATISDQGAGMPPESLDRLFRRFSPHRHDRQETVAGVGLGLAFVQSVVEGHGGRIGCRSAVGVGTTFDLEFPALRVGEPKS